MKKILFLALVLADACGLRAQQAPQFTMPIWFEDAIGNRDTLWVGSDVAASSREINPQFGEVELTSPFDSVFEVRGVHGDDPQWRTSKIVIEYTSSGGWCLLPGHTRIMIHALHWPVKISWDTMLLKQIAPCHENIFLTPTELYGLYPNWYEADVLYCMMTRSHIEEDFVYDTFVESLLQHEFPVQGLGTKTLNGLFYAGAWDEPHCYTTLLNSASETSALPPVNIFPNPAEGQLYMDIGQPETVAGLSIASAVSGNVFSRQLDTAANSWDISSLPPGLYLFYVTLKDGRRIARRFVKI
jgi:hypothetical protein